VSDAGDKLSTVCRYRRKIITVVIVTGDRLIGRCYEIDENPEQGLKGLSQMDLAFDAIHGPF
jgi:hypothetical protein